MKIVIGNGRVIDPSSGSRAAAAGGFTSICCMPNTKPVNDSAMVISHIGPTKGGTLTEPPASL